MFRKLIYKNRFQFQKWSLILWYFNKGHLIHFYFQVIQHWYRDSVGLLTEAIRKMDSSNTIQALLKAEQSAKMIVDQARQERKAQLKRAQLEANEEIIAAKDAATQEVTENNFLPFKLKHHKHEKQPIKLFS